MSFNERLADERRRREKAYAKHVTTQAQRVLREHSQQEASFVAKHDAPPSGPLVPVTALTTSPDRLVANLGLDVAARLAVKISLQAVAAGAAREGRKTVPQSEVVRALRQAGLPGLAANAVASRCTPAPVKPAPQQPTTWAAALEAAEPNPRRRQRELGRALDALLRQR